MTFALAIIVFITGLMLCGYRSRNGFVLSCCDRPPEGKNSPPVILSQLKMMVSTDIIYKPDGSNQEIERPKCDKYADNAVARGAEYYFKRSISARARRAYLLRDSSRDSLDNFCPDPLICLMPPLHKLFVESEGNFTNGINWYRGPCFELQFRYYQDALNTEVAEKAIETIRSYRYNLQRIVEAGDEYCQKCNTADPTTCKINCDPSYDFYDNVLLDRRRLAISYRQDFWNVVFIKYLCNIHFLTAAEVVTISRNNDPTNYKIYKDYVKKDTIDCLEAMAASIDFSIQNANDYNLPNTPAYRAFIYRDIRDWLEMFNNVSETKDVGTGNAGRELKYEAKLMIRDPGQGWFSCWDADRNDSFCEWTSCPGAGPKYNDAGGQHVWSDCWANVFTIKKLASQSSKGGIVRANDDVYLYNQPGGRLYWGVDQLSYDWAARMTSFQEMECKDNGLTFKCATNPDVWPDRAHFIIEAWDWTGRKREAGEPILDRDYVVFKFYSLPDYKALRATGGLFYIEGFLFVGQYGQ